MPDASCCSSCNTGPRPRTDVSAISAAAWQLCPVPGRQWDACTQAAAPPCCVGTLEAQRSSAHCSHLHDRLQRSGDLLLQLRASFLGAGRADGRASHTRGEGASETQQLLCGQRCCGVWAPGVSRQGAAGTASAGPPQRSVQAGVCIVTGSGHRCRSPPARVISGGGRGEGAAPVPASWPPAPPGAARMPTSCSARCASCWVGSSPAASVTTEAAGLAGPASGGGGEGEGAGHGRGSGSVAARGGLLVACCGAARTAAGAGRVRAAPATQAGAVVRRHPAQDAGWCRGGHLCPCWQQAGRRPGPGWRPPPARRPAGSPSPAHHTATTGALSSALAATAVGGAGVHW